MGQFFPRCDKCNAFVERVTTFSKFYGECIVFQSDCHGMRKTYMVSRELLETIRDPFVLFDVINKTLSFNENGE